MGKESIFDMNATEQFWKSMLCLECKHFKSCFSPVPNVIELNCKKGNKTFLADKPFACGQFKPKRRK